MLKEIRKIHRQRIVRVNRARAKVIATADRPRLVLHRSNKFIYAQIVTVTGQVLATASSRQLAGKTPVERAHQVGAALAVAAKAKGVDKVAFDRRGYKYHGQVQALAEGAREGGLSF